MKNNTIQQAKPMNWLHALIYWAIFGYQCRRGTVSESTRRARLLNEGRRYLELGQHSKFDKLMGQSSHGDRELLRALQFGWNAAKADSEDQGLCESEADWYAEEFKALEASK